MIPALENLRQKDQEFMAIGLSGKKESRKKAGREEEARDITTKKAKSTDFSLWSRVKKLMASYLTMEFCFYPGSLKLN